MPIPELAIARQTSSGGPNDGQRVGEIGRKNYAKTALEWNLPPVRFEEAAEVFADANALSQFDTEHSNGEDRWITLGLDRAGRLLVVCHTFQEMSKTRARVRIFSGRKATKSDRRSYEKSDL